MARERTGFIVSQVCAVIEYTDATGEHHNVTKAANARAADPKSNLTDAQKQALKVKHAKQLGANTIAELKKQGATKCKASIKTRLFARVGYTDDQGKRHDKVRAASLAPMLEIRSKTFCGTWMIAAARRLMLRE